MNMHLPQSTALTKGTTLFHDFCSELVTRYQFLSRIPQDVENSFLAKMITSMHAFDIQ